MLMSFHHRLGDVPVRLAVINQVASLGAEAKSTFKRRLAVPRPSFVFQARTWRLICRPEKGSNDWLSRRLHSPIEIHEAVRPTQDTKAQVRSRVFKHLAYWYGIADALRESSALSAMAQNELANIVTPEAEGGLRVLSLDGGGIRGVSELIILEQLMLRLKRKLRTDEIPKPCDVFHMICGTSTGGLIAIMLGRLRMSVTECIGSYADFSKNVFGDPESGWKFKDGHFKAANLEKAVKDTVAGQQQGEKMMDVRKDACKVFVCAKSTASINRARRFRTYTVNNISDDCAIWEAARATTAAPTFFKPVDIAFRPGMTERFIDGGLGCNNPILELCREIKDVYSDREIDCIISLGTGKAPRGELPRPKWWEKKVPRNVLPAILHIATEVNENHDLMLERFEGKPNTYFRFSVDQGMEKIGLGEWDMLGDVRSITVDYIESHEVERNVDLAATALQTSLCSIQSLLPPKDVQLDTLGPDLGTANWQRSLPLQNPSERHAGGNRNSAEADKTFLAHSDTDFFEDIGAVDLPGQDDEQQRVFLSCLKVDPWSMYNVRKKKPTRLEGTCEWIHAKPAFKQWQADPGPQILMIVAPPGQGKSVLAKYISQNVLEDQRSASEIALEFFCQDYPGRNTALSIVQSLLFQLLDRRRPLFRYIFQHHTRSVDQDQFLPFSSLWEIFMNVLSSPDIPQVHIVIDGIDECEEESQVDFLNAIEESFSSPSATESLPAKKIRMLLTSRPTALARKFGLFFKTIEIRNSDSGPDISKFIRWKVQKMTSTLLLPADDSRIADLLEAQADGMFLWVALNLDQFNHLDDELSENDIFLKLREIPKGLQELYSRAMERIQESPRSRENARKVLDILLTTPYPLPVEVFAFAFTTINEHGDSHLKLRRRIPQRIEYMAKAACGSLISTVDGLIQVCHQSARQYLLSPICNFGSFHTTYEERHLRLAQSCIRYLLLEDIEMPSKGQNPDNSRFPFLQYALQNWPLHIREAGETIGRCTPLLGYFFTPRRSRLRQCVRPFRFFNRAFPEDEDPPPALPVHVAAYFDLFNVIELLRVKGSSEISRDHHGDSTALIDIESDIDTRNWQKDTPLIVATFRQSLEAVRVLLRRGANPNAVNRVHRSPLFYAETVGIARELLDHGADIDTHDTDGTTPLHHFAGEGRLSIIYLLIRQGADINHEDFYGDTPLDYAIKCGELNTLALLLRYHPAIQHEWDQRSPLHTAAEYGTPLSIEMLLKHGIDVNARAKDEQTPLHYGARSGSPENIYYLIDAGANVHATSRKGATALGIAVESSNVKAVDILLRAGANSNVRDRNGNSPLHLGAGLDSEITSRLLASGADPNSRDLYGSTPLMIAAYRGNATSVRRLLEAKADPNIAREDNSTALLMATWHHRHSTIEVLLEFHADPFALDFTGWSSLDSAQLHPETSRILSTKLGDFKLTDPSSRRKSLRDFCSGFTVRLAEHPDNRIYLFHLLGRCLLLLQDLTEATVAYEQTIYSVEGLEHGAFCDSCDEEICGLRFVCHTCSDTDLCVACLRNLTDGTIDVMGCSAAHKFLQVPSNGYAELPHSAVNTAGETIHHWLQRIRDTYTDPDLSDGT